MSAANSQDRIRLLRKLLGIFGSATPWTLKDSVQPVGVLAEAHGPFEARDKSFAVTTDVVVTVPDGERWRITQAGISLSGNGVASLHPRISLRMNRRPVDDNNSAVVQSELVGAAAVGTHWVFWRPAQTFDLNEGESILFSDGGGSDRVNGWAIVYERVDGQ